MNKLEILNVELYKCFNCNEVLTQDEVIIVPDRDFRDIIIDVNIYCKECMKNLIVDNDVLSKKAEQALQEPIVLDMRILGDTDE